MTKSKFIEYAGEVQDYCLMLTKTSDVTGVEYFESEFASPLDIMEKMIFDQFDKKFDDSFSEEFWHLAIMEDTDRDDWADFYDKFQKFKKIQFYPQMSTLMYSMKQKVTSPVTQARTK